MRTIPIAVRMAIALSAVALHPMGCDSDRSTPPASDGLSVPVEQLLAAPEEVGVAGQHYVLETSLYRDFMPPAPADGWPMRAFVWLTEADSLEIPSTIDMNTLWVIRDGQEVWQTGFRDDYQPSLPPPPHQLKKSAEGGPKWTPRIFVDVVVRIVDGEGNVYLLRAAEQLVERSA